MQMLARHKHCKTNIIISNSMLMFYIIDKKASKKNKHKLPFWKSAQRNTTQNKAKH